MGRFRDFAEVGKRTGDFGGHLFIKVECVCTLKQLVFRKRYGGQIGFLSPKHLFGNYMLTFTFIPFLRLVYYYYSVPGLRE